ncbi:SusD-like starch-binding protein associating with outer membrane [Taibaiella chishuiensis]|uniref:SusD-like starch-binding protein associating with outer membrane n=2 Tax=Taibaiella chishuiensis TaxID=1434707 RepID=A0A2P8D0R1_9BACT|nr:SusD-like starch-binding protein associating with outer membrane [Taibaiella chishuiensis]
MQIIYSAFLIVLVMAVAGCKKQNDWLDAKSQNSFVVPETLKDYQALLENPITVHNAFSIFGLVGADNYYLRESDFPGSAEDVRNGYIWRPSIWVDGNSPDWNSFFAIIELSNIILDGLSKKGLNNDQATFNSIKGQALFYRAISYYNLSQLFCKTYDAGSASSDLGLPIRLNSNVNIIYQRSSIEETYKQMVADTKAAIELLPATQVNNRRPTKIAANALLAKIYLCMEVYAEAEYYASESLKLNSTLLDFNSSYASLNLTYRFAEAGINHPEILFYAQGVGYSPVIPHAFANGRVSMTLINLYNANDLRKLFFFASNGNEFQYRGTYTGNTSTFCGIANNEVFLISAEAKIRTGDINGGVTDVNTLLSKRYKTGTFVPYTITDGELALSLVLEERRKELPFVANLRWEDLRRLNKDPRFKITLTRQVAGVNYILEPGSNKYVLPIPDNEIQISGISQNPR